MNTKQKVLKSARVHVINPLNALVALVPTLAVAAAATGKASPWYVAGFGAALFASTWAFRVWRDVRGWKCSACGSTGMWHESPISGLAECHMCPVCREYLE